MIKFNLQLFAKPGFEFKQLSNGGGGSATTKKKKKTTPTVPEIPLATKKTDPQPIIDTTKQQTEPEPISTPPLREVVDVPEPVEEIAIQQSVTPPKKKDSGESDADKLRRSIAEAAERRRKAAVEKRFQETSAAIDIAESKIDPSLRETRGRIETASEMDQARARKLSAGFGPSGSGSLAQSQLGLSAIKGGQLSDLAVEEQRRKDEIEQLRVQAERERSFGLQGIEDQAAIDQMTQQLKQIELQDERDYQEYIRQVEKMDARESLIFENDLKRENAVLDAEIQSLRDRQLFEQDLQIKNQLFQQEQVLIDQKAQNDIKLQGIKARNDIALQQLRGSQDIALQELRGTQALDEIAAKGEEDIRQIIARGDESTETGVNIPTSSFKSGINRQINQSAINAELSGTNFGPAQVQQIVINSVIDNVDSIRDENQLIEILTSYNVPISAVDAELDRRSTQGVNQ